MRYLYIYFIQFIVIFFLISCTEKTTYTGKMINADLYDYENLKNKQEILSFIGEPNFIDPVENKYYYFSEQIKTKNFYNKKIENRTMLVFLFDKDANVEKFTQYNLDDEKDIKYIKESTPNELIKRGLIQKIFGGVGQTVPTVSDN